MSWFFCGLSHKHEEENHSSLRAAIALLEAHLDPEIPHYTYTLN
jgi:hypothetical protein